jgi:hypothetical protein
VDRILQLPFISFEQQPTTTGIWFSKVPCMIWCDPWGQQWSMAHPLQIIIPELTKLQLSTINRNMCNALKLINFLKYLMIFIIY